MTPQAPLDAPPQTAPSVAISPERYWLFRGPSAYVAVTPWSWWGGGIAAVGIFLGAVVAVGLVVLVAAIDRYVHGMPLGAAFDAATNSTTVQIFATLMQQVAMIGLTWLAASRYGGAPSDVLALRAPAQGIKAYVAAFALLLLAAFGMSVLIRLSELPVDKNDIKMFHDMLHSPWWPFAFVVGGIGAPLSEEFLCRGFLFSALARSRAGILGAAILTSLGFALAHPYSLVGVSQVFVIGMLFAWVLIRTGSLRVTMVCHALFNTLQTVLLMLNVDT